MSRLIDADALAEIFSDRMEKIAERYGVYSSESGILSGAYTLLQSQPTIEPKQPQIIHCKDCKYSDDDPMPDGRCWCHVFRAFMYYCSEAKGK